jgi:hypothetical protein
LKLTNSFKSEDLYGEDCHDDSDAELDGLLIEASTKDTQCKLASDTSRIILQGGNLQCKHSCKDKTQYASLLYLFHLFFFIVERY